MPKYSEKLSATVSKFDLLYYFEHNPGRKIWDKELMEQFYPGEDEKASRQAIMNRVYNLIHNDGQPIEVVTRGSCWRWIGEGSKEVTGLFEKVMELSDGVWVLRDESGNNHLFRKVKIS